MTEELFIGIACAPAGHIAHAVCLDDLGRLVEQTTFAWTPEKLRHVLARLATGPLEISIGLWLGEYRPDVLVEGI